MDGPFLCDLARLTAPGPVDGNQPRLGLTPIPKPGR